MKPLLIAVCACAAAACASNKPAERPDAPVESAAPLMVENPVEDPMSAESVAAAGEPSPSQAETEQAAQQEGYDQPVFRGVSAEEAAAKSFSTAKSEPETKPEEPSSATEPQPEQP